MAAADITGVTPVPAPDESDMRRELVLVEDRVGHYAEFRAFLARSFDLDRVGLRAPGFLRAPSGTVYALVFIGRSGEPFPAGVEVHAVVAALEPIDDAAVDRDLWAILHWLVAGAGWSADELEATGRLYRIPAASPPA